jgi:metal-responsive CopG/Arc/MetJ family transcriptional regulator
MKTSYIHIRIQKELKDQFDELCKDNAINQSELIRKWIVEYIQKTSQK